MTFIRWYISFALMQLHRAKLLAYGKDSLFFIRCEFILSQSWRLGKWAEKHILSIQQYDGNNHDKVDWNIILFIAPPVRDLDMIEICNAKEVRIHNVSYRKHNL